MKYKYEESEFSDVSSITDVEEFIKDAKALVLNYNAMVSIDEVMRVVYGFRGVQVVYMDKNYDYAYNIVGKYVEEIK